MLDPALVLEHAGQWFGVTASGVARWGSADNNQRPIDAVLARAVAALCFRRHTILSYPEIAAAFNYRSHTSVLELVSKGMSGWFDDRMPDGMTAVMIADLVAASVEAQQAESAPPCPR